MLAKFHAVIRALVSSKKVTIAAVHGHCLGGGAELAMVCDLVYTAETAMWGFPEIKLGCYPPVAATALAALVGQKHAADLILTGRSITGTEAARIGLANRAVGDVELEAAVQDAVQQLSKLSPAALAITKKANYAWDSMHFDKGLARAEKIYLEELMKTEDVHEGINAFLEKRAAGVEGEVERAMSKLLTMREAIAELVPDGASVALGLQMEQMIPFAAGHEIIRQKKRGLTLIGPISDILFDQMIAAGCAERVIAAWVGNVMMGSAYNFRRAVEQGSLKVVNLSNFAVALALQASGDGRAVSAHSDGAGQRCGSGE